MLTSFVRLEKFNFYLLIDLLVRQFRCQQGYEVPIKCACQTLFYFTLVNRLVCARSKTLVKYKKVHSASVVKAAFEGKAHFFVVLAFLFISCDLDRATLTLRSVFAH
jgi:hypothetical protein